MNDGSFPLAHVAFHLVLILLLHSQRAQRGAKGHARRSHTPEPVCIMPPGFRLRNNQDRKGIPKAKGTTMKPIIRYRSQLLFRKSYKPSRAIRSRPARKAALGVRPARAGPQINTYEYETN